MIPRRTRKAVHQINVVPYIDVMLVLLVIFMVTAPFINPAQVDLPSMGKSAATPHPGQPVVISADKGVRYEKVMQVMDTLQTLGVAHVGLLVKPAQH